ncbi:MAG TPA: recombinase family protein [Azospirillum sp.]|nr:recombinase family protein [Azospirillum sp.]
MASLIGYGRVSTDEQTTALQEDALAKAGCARLFLEKVSGAKAPKERPELARALDYLRSGDTLVVWRLDRLARSLPDLIATVADLERRGVGFCSLSESIDTTTAAGRLTFHIFGALAEFERNLIRERTRAGLTAAAARGRHGGRRQSVTTEHLDDAAMLLRAGRSADAVAKRLGITRATLYSYLPDGGVSAVLVGAPLLATPRKRDRQVRANIAPKGSGPG